MVATYAAALHAYHVVVHKYALDTCPVALPFIYRARLYSHPSPTRSRMGAVRSSGQQLTAANYRVFLAAELQHQAVHAATPQNVPGA
jgi:hypothetical protein